MSNRSIMTAVTGRWLALLAVAGLLCACDYEPRVAKTVLPPTTPTKRPVVTPVEDPDPAVTDPVVEQPKPVVVDPIRVPPGDDTPVTLTPPDEPIELPTRPRRRMDIDQLDRAIQQVTGGFAWTELQGGREVNQFEALAQTLGKPDFVETTQEDLTASALFQKFLNEAARTVCDRLATAEAAGETSVPILFRYATPTDTVASAPEAIDANLAALLLRFHGSRMSPDDPAFEPWRWLFASALHVSDDPVTAWRTVCIGLIIHPAFYTY